MKYLFFFLLFSILSIGCQQRPDEGKLIGNYYEIGSLLNSAVNGYSNYPISVKKTVVIDQRKEEQSFSLDVTGLKKETEMLNMLDINQSGLVGAYLEEKEGNITKYRLRDQEKQTGIIQLTIEENKNTKKISGLFKEENSLYFSTREFDVLIEKNLLKSYHITGAQKMMFKDTVSFSIDLAIKD